MTRLVDGPFSKWTKGEKHNSNMVLPRDWIVFFFNSHSHKRPPPANRGHASVNPLAEKWLDSHTHWPTYTSANPLAANWVYSTTHWPTWSRHEVDQFWVVLYQVLQ